MKSGDRRNKGIRRNSFLFCSAALRPCPPSQSSRTEGEVPFEAALADLPEPPIYQKIFEKALHLNQLGMNPNRIAVHLGVDRTTVTRALRCIRSH